MVTTMTNINNFTPRLSGTHRRFVSSENRCTHIAENPAGKYVRQFKVDGEVFPSSGNGPKRCDYLILNDTDGDAYYIELKGSDIRRAIEQVESSIVEINPSIGYDVHCRIIFRTFTQEVKGAEVLRWKRKQKDAVITSVQYTDRL